MLFGDYRCFFFQAEDGIRYLTVTGVQTCALPIYKSSGPRSLEFKSGGARRLRERLHAPMVFIAGAVEGNLLDAVFLRLDGDALADDLGGLAVAAVLQLGPDVLLQRGSACDDLVARSGRELGIDMAG